MSDEKIVFIYRLYLCRPILFFLCVYEETKAYETWISSPSSFLQHLCFHWHDWAISTEGEKRVSLASAQVKNVSYFSAGRGR